MSESTVIPEDAKTHFWIVVRECLIEFHGTPRNSSEAKIAQFRKQIEGYPTEAMELLYHNEPFDVACRIANERIRVDGYIERYVQIRDREPPLRADE